MCQSSQISFFLQNEVFTKENTSFIPGRDQYFIDNELDSFVITEEIVRTKLVALKTSRSEGPDGFHPHVLSEVAVILCKPLCKIFNQPLATSEFPQDWKIGNVTLVQER